MTLTVRLDAELENQLARMSERLRLSKSEIIKRSLREYLEIHAIKKTPYSLGADLFEGEGSGKGDLAERHSEYIKAKLRAKRSR